MVFFLLLYQYILFVLESKLFLDYGEYDNKGIDSCEMEEIKATTNVDQQVITSLESHEGKIPTPSFEKDRTVQGMYSKH